METDLMSDAYQDKDLQSVEKDTGQTLSSILQVLAMGTAFLRRPKARVEIKKPTQPKPEPHPEMAHKGVSDDMLYIEVQRAQGKLDEEIKQDLTQLSQVHQNTQAQYGNGDEYLDKLIANAARSSGGKLPGQGLVAQQAQQKTMKR